MRKLILFIYAAFSFFCSVAASSSPATRFNAAAAVNYPTDVSYRTFIEENSNCDGNRLKYGSIGSITFESGPAYIGITRCLRTTNLNVVKLLFSEEEINNLDAVMTLTYKSYGNWLDRASTLASKVTGALKPKIQKFSNSTNLDLDSVKWNMQSIAQQLQRNAGNRIYTYCKQMSSFYHYIQSFGGQLERLPQWNIREYDMGQTFSATHTEFIMVYKILQDAGMQRMEGGLLQMNSVKDFREALDTLKGKLPKEIYSAKAMCPVCEAFLTSLYNVCGCKGVFISKLNDYNSPSGPEGSLQKVYLNETGGTYADLPTDNRKKPAH